MSTSRSWHEQAMEQNPVLLREMIRLLEGFTGSDEDRMRIERWTRKVKPENQQGGPFQGHGNASAVFDSLWNVRDQDDHVGGYLVRVEEARSYIEDLTRGGGAWLDMSKFAFLRMSFEELASRLKQRPIRWILDGIGWRQSVRFCSVVSGREFGANVAAQGYLRRLEPPGTMVMFERDADPREATLELLETLEIDTPDLVHGMVPLEARWVLVRQDDNGNRFEIQRFVSTSGARAKLAEFEALSHKQTYWLERVPPAP